RDGGRLGNGRKLGEFAVRTGSMHAQGADAFGDVIQRRPFFGVLGHEHLVQRVEQRTSDVPVEVVRHQIQGIAVGKHLGKFGGDSSTVFIGNADVDAHRCSAGGFGRLGHVKLLYEDND